MNRIIIPNHNNEVVVLYEVQPPLEIEYPGQKIYTFIGIPASYARIVKSLMFLQTIDELIIEYKGNKLYMERCQPKYNNPINCSQLTLDVGWVEEI